ncbi:hypothetical protein G039_0328765 [Pseudomonas aeruginosa VRFPA01]|nr:hypothetical protein G039_0332090 [Pseudomonas aeruginosa VRFPA01]KFF32691.1 hypothetical protein G039_0328765 [Pseudomonas aeruginosa VRFPA01]
MGVLIADLGYAPHEWLNAHQLPAFLAQALHFLPAKRIAQQSIYVWLQSFVCASLASQQPHGLREILVGDVDILKVVFEGLLHDFSLVRHRKKRTFSRWKEDVNFKF